jgi:YggT family protein
MLPIAAVQNEIADFLSALLFVYTLCIIAWIVLQLVFSLGARVPYSRWVSAVMDFLRVGPLDLTPMVAIIVLQVVGGIVVGIIDSA